MTDALVGDGSRFSISFIFLIFTKNVGKGSWVHIPYKNGVKATKTGWDDIGRPFIMHQI
jgi:hypothetical protein